MLRMVLIALFLLVTSTASRAEQFSESDRGAIRAVITQQIEAFRADDGVRAYGYAAPNIQKLFSSPETFMAMVKRGYQPVYRPQSFQFSKPGNDSNQRVTIIGPDGRTYEALYTMERQPDGTWRIAGCALLEVPGVNT